MIVPYLNNKNGFLLNVGRFIVVNDGIIGIFQLCWCWSCRCWLLLMHIGRDFYLRESWICSNLVLCHRQNTPRRWTWSNCSRLTNKRVDRSRFSLTGCWLYPKTGPGIFPQLPRNIGICFLTKRIYSSSAK